MVRREKLSFELRQALAQGALVSSVGKVTIEAEVVDALYKSAVAECASRVAMPGFQAGTVPIAYVARNYHTVIIEHLRDFLVAFCIEAFLREQLRKHRLVLLGKPECIEVSIELGKSALFVFELNTIQIPINSGWKYLHFKQPTRKNYRDLDNQVTAFLAEEQLYATHHKSPLVNQLDWVHFSVVPQNSTEVFAQADPACLWMRIGNEDPDQEAQETFLEKSVDSNFTTKAYFLQEYFSAMHESQYTFSVHIKHHTPYALFALDRFKQHFKLRSERDMHRKLIEVFSYRHDMSQRRETAEAVLKMLVKMHPFQIPTHLLRDETVSLIDIICTNPDYYVYKAQPDFHEKVQLLAMKKLKEAALMDALAFSENIVATDQDILDYINLLKRPRTKEFVYFSLPDTKIQEREVPLSHELLYQSCLREKTLNHAIHTLTKAVA